jgi:GH24 family phage-related lysozyme (muramidase)
MPSTTDKKISATNLFGKESNTGKLARIVRSNKKGIAINARKITILKNITKEQQKQDAGDTVGDKLPGGGGSLKGILGDIASTMSGIVTTLQDQNKLDVRAAADQRKDDEKKKRSLKESAIEGVKGTIKKAADAVTKPFISLWDQVIGFITTIFTGRIAIKLWEWFSDPANTEKVTSIFRFLKDWWPAIVAGLIAFASPLLGPVGVIAGITALVIWGVSKIQDAIKSIFGFGKAIDSELKSGSKQNEKDMLAAGDNANKGMEDQIKKGQQGQPEVSPKQTDSKASEGQNFNKGGQVPGKGDKDTVPAMLTPGEFVMSKGAVNKFGAGTLAGMNAAGGGSNSATMNGEGLMGFRGGGVVPGDDEEKKPQGLMRAAAGYADFLTGGIFDFDKRGGGLAGMMGGGGGGGNEFAKGMVKEHEGLRLDAYKDSKGFLTVGYGHLIDKGSPPDIQALQEGATITKERAEKLFEQDYKEHADAAKKIPGYGKADEKQQAALIDLTFNMGPDWHQDFPKFTAAFKAGNYELAGAELENSKWYGDVARRAPTIVSLIKGKGLPQGSYLGEGGGTGVPGDGGGGRYEGSTSTPANVTAPPPVSSIGPPVKTSTMAMAHTHDEDQGEQPLSQVATPNLPEFDAGMMVSEYKIRTLGITV